MTIKEINKIFNEHQKSKQIVITGAKNNTSSIDVMERDDFLRALSYLGNKINAQELLKIFDKYQKTKTIVIRGQKISIDNIIEKEDFLKIILYINMKYLKRNDYFEYNPSIPEWINYLINLEHYDSVEIAEFIEEMLGTKETPLTVYDGSNYYSKPTKVYGVSPDDLRFAHFNYIDSKNEIFYIDHKILSVLESKYNLKMIDIEVIMEKYIESIYELKCSNIKSLINII